MIKSFFQQQQEDDITVKFKIFFDYKDFLTIKFNLIIRNIIDEFVVITFSDHDRLQKINRKIKSIKHN